MLVRKRDGRLQEFEPDKILNSIKEAALAVEGKDDDIQSRQTQINEVMRNLMELGLEHDEAEEQAEEQFEGYLEDGIYTEYNEDDAYEVLNVVTEAIDSMNEDIIDTSLIQELVEKALMDTEHKRTAREYIIKGNNRSRIREMNTSLMKSYEDLTFGNSKDVDTKRENANIDGDSAMGTMLKYGSEGAKKFNLLYLVPPDESEAHSNGDIHIHDLDFMALTETCLSKDTTITVKIDSTIETMTVEEFASKVGVSSVDTWKSISNAEILSHGKFVTLKKIVKHNADDKHMLRISTNTGNLNVTSEHTICILNDNDEIIDIPVTDAKVGDRLVKSDLCTKRFNNTSIDIIDIYNGNNLAVYNTPDVIKNIKDNGNWKEFCNLFDYRDARAATIRAGKAKLTIKEFKLVEHLCSLNHTDLKIQYKRSRNNETINAIVPLTFELGNIIGLMYTEGSITEHECNNQESNVKKACFCNYDYNLIEQFNTNYKKVFNNAVLRDRTHNGVLTGTALSGYLQYELFHGVFGHKNGTEDIRLADWMFSANKEFINGIIAGIIDGDGCVQKDGYRVQIASISKEFLEDVQKLLFLRGITSRINKVAGAEKGTVAYFENDGICVPSERKFDNYRLEFTGDLNNKLGWITSNKINAIDLAESNKFPYRDVVINSIDEVEYSGYVYDLETEGNHFDANGFYVHNCVQIDIEKLFKGGFNTGHGFLREPGEIRSYAALACIAIQSDQNDQHGGQSIPSFDHYMAPGVAKSFIKNIYKILDIKYPTEHLQLDEPDALTNEGVKTILKQYREKHRLIMNKEGYEFIKKLLIDKYCLELYEEEVEQIIEKAKQITDDETHQAMEAVVHNLNSMHSRAGAQVPFSSLNFGTDTSEEGRMVSFNLLRATEEGLGNGETPIFPISIFKEKAGVSYNPEDPNYDLWEEACRVSAKRLFPNFSNLDAPYNAQYYKEGDIDTEVSYMGCRTRVIANTFDPSYEKVTGRGNLSFTSINLPRLGIKAGGDLNRFFDMLDDMMELVHRQLLDRFEIQCRKHPRNYPFLMGQGVWRGSEKLGPDDDIREILKQGTLTVGFIGLAECLKALTGKHHGESEESQRLGLAIISHMREMTDKWSKREKMNYSLIATPAEGLSGRFVGIDKKRFGIIPGVTDRDYYTNSFHVPVYYNISAFKKIDIEAPYHALTNGGHISYIELDGDPTKNLDAFKKVVRYMHDKGIGYGAINHPVDRDPVCGYVGIIDDVCPRCGRKEGEPMTEEMWRKIYGYAASGNAGTCGACGDPAEEQDRKPLKVE